LAAADSFLANGGRLYWLLWEARGATPGPTRQAAASPDRRGGDRPDGKWRRQSQEILAGLRLDRDEPIQVAGFQDAPQLLGVDPLGTLDDRFRVG
jgi:hypothetical protein